jgi:hypothetical protein
MSGPGALAPVVEEILIGLLALGQADMLNHQEYVVDAFEAAETLDGFEEAQLRVVHSMGELSPLCLPLWLTRPSEPELGLT